MLDSLLIAILLFTIFFVYFNVNEEEKNKPFYQRFSTFFNRIIDAFKELLGN